MKSQDNKGVAGGIIFGVCLLIIGFTLHENSALFIIGGLAMIGGMVLVLSCSSKDEEKELYRWNAHKGDSNAQLNLGLHFYEGYYQNGVHYPSDYSEALKWFRMAADQGNPKAQGYLANCYAFGKGVTQNYKEAAKWHHKAAEQGDKLAQNILGVYYSNGSGVVKNDVEAVKWYRRAAEQGYAMAQYNLGNCYYNGEGVKKDYNEAVHWFQKAAEQNLSDAQCNLGSCHYNGEGVTVNHAESTRLYRSAAEQGHAIAQLNLSHSYFDGSGVEQDFIEAYKWCYLVGPFNQDAQKLLTQLKEKLTSEQITEARRRISAFRPK